MADRSPRPVRMPNRVSATVSKQVLSARRRQRRQVAKAVSAVHGREARRGMVRGDPGHLCAAVAAHSMFGASKAHTATRSVRPCGTIEGGHELPGPVAFCDSRGHISGAIDGRRLRNALSHPAPDEEFRYRPTGFTATVEESGLICAYEFTDSPWVKNDRRQCCGTSLLCVKKRGAGGVIKHFYRDGKRENLDPRTRGSSARLAGRLAGRVLVRSLATAAPSDDRLAASPCDPVVRSTGLPPPRSARRSVGRSSWVRDRDGVPDESTGRPYVRRLRQTERPTRVAPQLLRQQVRRSLPGQRGGV